METVEIKDVLIEIRDVLKEMLQVYLEDKVSLSSGGGSLDVIEEEGEEESKEPESEQTNCYHVDVDGNEMEIVCPKPKCNGTNFCEEHVEEYNHFILEIEMYVKDALTLLTDEDKLLVKKFGRSWKSYLCEDLDITAKNLKSLIKQLHGEGKSVEEIVKLIESG